MNILISAIGSMSSEAVISSLRKLDGTRLIGCDIYDKEWIYPSMLVDVFYQIPRADSCGYIDELLSICLREDVQYIFPLTDPEVDILSSHRRVFEEKGIVICISPDDVIRVCRDKKLFFDHLSGMEDLRLLPTYTVDSLKEIKSASMVAKPKTGRSSEDLLIIEDREKIEFLIKDKEKYIFQPFLKGMVVTVDIIRDSFGDFFFIPRKELLRTKNGAGITVRLFNDGQITKSVCALVSRLSFLGCVNVEFLYDGKSYYLMDINPRFSAGIAFSQSTGYDFVHNHLRAFLGDRIDSGIDYESTVLCKRYVEFYSTRKHEVWN